MMKADSGPGRWDEYFRTVARSYGVYFYPGLPNGTELGQEMDQLYSLAKTLMEKNCDKLWRARCEFLASKAQTTTWDLPWIVFGGEIELENGKKVQLSNAFNEAFAPARLDRAATKCGYVPATRCLLNSKTKKTISDFVGDKLDHNVSLEMSALKGLCLLTEDPQWSIQCLVCKKQIRSTKDISYNWNATLNQRSTAEIYLVTMIRRHCQKEHPSCCNNSILNYQSMYCYMFEEMMFSRV